MGGDRAGQGQEEVRSACEMCAGKQARDARSGCGISDQGARSGARSGRALLSIVIPAPTPLRGCCANQTSTTGKARFRGRDQAGP